MTQGSTFLQIFLSHRAELLGLDDNLLTAAGLPAPTGPPQSVLYSPGVPVTFGAPGPLDSAR